MSQQDYFIEFARELGNLNGNLTAVLKRIEERMAKNDEMMARHEARISMLEGKERGRASALAHGADGHGGSLPRWAVYVIVGLLAALLGALGVKIPGVM